jgi:hypothetical protein
MDVFVASSANYLATSPLNWRAWRDLRLMSAFWRKRFPAFGGDFFSFPSVPLLPPQLLDVCGSRRKARFLFILWTSPGSSWPTSSQLKKIWILCFWCGGCYPGICVSCIPQYSLSVVVYDCNPQLQSTVVESVQLHEEMCARRYQLIRCKSWSRSMTCLIFRHGYWDLVDQGWSWSSERSDWNLGTRLSCLAAAPEVFLL